MLDAERKAKEFCEGGAASLETVVALVEELREAGRLGPIGSLLSAAGRRALYHGWEPAQRAMLAGLLRDHQQFGYARRLFGRVRDDGDGSLELCRQHALCTYKDLELPVARRLDRALEILGEGAPIEDSDSAETLGIAGAIYKRRWEVDAKRADLESALWCYERGYALVGAPQRDYAGINAAFVADQLAALERKGLGASGEAERLTARADEMRAEIAARLEGGDGGWADATLGEAHFGLGDFAEAGECLARVRDGTKELWRLESTAMQIAALSRLRGLDVGKATEVLEALVGEAAGAIRRGHTGKVGLALSGGGFRASLFHIGVLARLAECDVLRRVEVLSCVSGGSIVGSYYYLRLRQLLERTPDSEVGDVEYVKLVAAVADEFMDGVRGNLRGRLTESIGANWRMLASRYSRTNRVGELLDEQFFSKVPKGGRDAADAQEAPDGQWKMTDLFVEPAGRGDGFSLRYENWLRAAKVPILVLNATTLNTGHNWQFTASWMGEPPVGVAEKVDASRRLRRLYYRDAPKDHQEPPLSTAVAASACVPALFPPVTLAKLYAGVDVELVDGGVHDNQGIASLLEQDCSVILVSDASGQARDDEHPSRGLLGVAKRSNSVLMSRVRQAQYSELADRRRADVLRGLMVVHLKKGLPATPRDWIECPEPYRPEDDALRVPGGSDVSPYGFDHDAQRALAEMRTDLDAFSDNEAYSLMAAGYAMVKHELSAALPELSAGDPALEGAVEWPFASALERLAEPADHGLEDTLQAGHSRFFRRVVAWRLRRRRREKGRLRALFDRTGLPKLPRTAAWVAKRGVLAPVRAVVSAPLALVGGLATRLSLRIGRPRRGS